MKTTIKHILTVTMLLCCTGIITAQNSLPAPGTGGAPASPPSFPSRPIGPGPGWGGPGPGWGGPWGGPWNSPMVVNTTYVTPAIDNTGTEAVVGVGYDARGVWRTVPMTVQYTYNGVDYNVTVLNAWNPWTQMWSYDVDTNAYATSYFLRGTQYDYYVVLSTGTYYFNL